MDRYKSWNFKDFFLFNIFHSLRLWRDWACDWKSFSIEASATYSYKQKNHIPLCSQYKNWKFELMPKIFPSWFSDWKFRLFRFVQFTVQCVYRSEVIFDSFIDSVFNFDAFGSFSKYIQTTVYVWIYCLFFSPSNTNKNQCGGIEFCNVCIWFNLSGATHLKFTHFIYISENVHVYDRTKFKTCYDPSGSALASP